MPSLSCTQFVSIAGTIYMALPPGQTEPMIGHFKGCVRDLQFNSEHLRYLDRTTIPDGITVSSADMRTGCLGI